MSFSTSNDYIKLIIEGFKDVSKIYKNRKAQELNEYEIDIFSKDLFQQLYNNMLCFCTSEKDNTNPNEVQNYFYLEIANILDIFHESNPQAFFYIDFLKSVLILLVYSLKTPIYINLEFVLKIFLGFEDIISCINNKTIDDDVCNFEEYIINTIDILDNKCIIDYEIDLDISNKRSNFNEIIACLILHKNGLPLYLLGFILYNKLSNKNKFLLIKIYKYIELINPYKNNDLDFSLYQGYALYGITTNKNIPIINFNDFNNIKKNRIKNEDAKYILESAIQLLEQNNYYSFGKKIGEKLFDSIPGEPKISDTFDNIKEYYNELHNQLNYYLYQYKTNINRLCPIIDNEIPRILWLNFTKILLLNLGDGDIQKNQIKIIFYFIVNLFNPDIDNNSLEFRNDAISMLFPQCSISKQILDFQEIYKIIDIDYSKWYPKFDVDNDFTQAFIKFQNSAILDSEAVKELKDEKIKLEIKKIEKFNNNLPFPLLKNYLDIKNIVISKNSSESSGLYNFYKNCFCDINDNDKEYLFLCLLKAHVPDNEKSIKKSDIEKILLDHDFVKLTNDIMKSPVMQDAYTRIYIWYSTDGKFNLNKEKIDDGEIPQKPKDNLINDNTLYYYYSQFCNEIQEINNTTRFIVMALPETIKGFTFRFLKIVLNSEGIGLENFNSSNKLILLKAYLIFVIILEVNHFIKRFFNKEKINNLYTPEIKDFDDEGGEGGNQQIKLLLLLFDHILIKNFLNVEQAKYILNLNNWNKNSSYEFKKGFLNIIDKKGDSIIYLISVKESLCDHSKLFA